MYLPQILASNPSYLCADVITKFADTHSADIPAVAFWAFSVCERSVWASYFTHQGDVEEVLVLLDLGEGGGDVGVEVVPSQAKLLRGHCCWEERLRRWMKRGQKRMKVDESGCKWMKGVTCRSPPRGGRFLVWLLQLGGCLVGI